MRKYFPTKATLYGIRHRAKEIFRKQNQVERTTLEKNAWHFFSQHDIFLLKTVVFAFSDKAAHLCMKCLQEFPNKPQLKSHLRTCEGIETEKKNPNTELSFDSDEVDVKENEDKNG